MAGHGSPEDAVRAVDSVPAEFARVVLVDHSPDGEHAVVLLEYNEPPSVEPYVVICERTPSGWVEWSGGSGDGYSWTPIPADGATGVEVTWGRPPTVRWGVPWPGRARASP